jgi:N-terminal domain of anti-restriction factor ArdC
MERQQGRHQRLAYQTKPKEGQGTQPADAPALLSQVNGYLQTLTEELSQGKSQRLQDYLSFAARFHEYSRSNQWLIQAQMPTATRIASYHKWQEEGYQVAKGARGIRILAPSIRKIKVTADQDTEQEDQNAVAGDVKKVVRFVAVSVFDVSQLTPEKRPAEFFTPIEGNEDALYEHIATAATKEGFQIEQTEYTRGAEGYSSGRRIVTRSNLASVNRVLTSVHEYAHGLLHQGFHPLAKELSLRRNQDLSTVSSNLKECHAEATAYVVATHFGLPTPFSSDYLLNWGTTPERLRDELDVVLAAARHIIRAVEGVAQDPLAEPATF